jgi:hypothetical protein
MAQKVLKKGVRNSKKKLVARKVRNFLKNFFKFNFKLLILNSNSNQTPEGYISKDINILSYIQKGYFISFFGAGYFEDIISYF